jgi:hypothetical protein
MLRQLRQKPGPESEERYAADVAQAAKLGELIDAARKADVELREAEVRNAPLPELHRLAKSLDAVLTDAVHAAYAAQRVEIGPLGYQDRIYTRKARAKPAVRARTAEAERLLTLRENHRMNHIPEIPPQPQV